MDFAGNRPEDCNEPFRAFKLRCRVNAWSREIDKYDGFIFLTPQYNWSFPAAIKCAISHLFHEWAAKPTLIVSYGKRGGPKANAQLRQALLGLRTSAWEGKVELPIIAGNGMENSVKGILDPEVLEAWNNREEKGELLARWSDLVEQASIKI